MHMYADMDQHICMYWYMHIYIYVHIVAYVQICIDV